MMEKRKTDKQAKQWINDINGLSKQRSKSKKGKQANKLTNEWINWVSNQRMNKVKKLSM